MKPAIFLAFANDRVDPTRFLRSLNRELKLVRDALVDQAAAATGDSARWDVHDVPDATIDDLVTGLARFRDRVALFHYGGHAGDYELLLQTANGLPAVANAGGLAQLLGTQRGLQCVFLNGCSTKGQVDDLLAAGVPAVIATRHEIEDDLALDFARYFYGALATGASLDRAFSEAHAAVQTSVGEAKASPAATPDPATRTVGKRATPVDTDRVPWELHVAPGADLVREWSLGAAAGDALFGLPALPEKPLPPSPFRHLRWFTSDDAELFFGRGREIHALYESVTAPNASPVTLLFGQSGSGKSSLLDAGVSPRLAATHDVRYARRDETIGLSATLAAALGTPSDRPRVVIVDQIEEAYTKPRKDDANELETFVASLASLVKSDSTTRVILAFRKEWLAEVARRLAEAHVPYQQVFLERLDRAGIVDAVTSPGRIARLRRQYNLEIVGDELATVIADDLLADAGSAVAPTLQVLLSKMWEQPDAQRSGHVVFDVSLYQRLKNDGILLGDFLDGQFAKLAEWKKDVVASGLALDVLQAHTTTLVTSRTRATADVAALYAGHAELSELLEQCTERYLLLDASTPTVPATTLAHDTLAPLVRKRFEVSVMPGQRARRVLDARCDEWSEGKVGRTLDRADLKMVEEGRSGMRAWTPDEIRLVEASRIACAREIRTKRFARTAAVVGVLLVAALGTLAGIAGLRARRDAARATRAVVVSAATAQADAVEGALLLATLDSAPEPPGALQAGLTIGAQSLPTSVVDHGDVSDPILSEDGGVLVARAASGGILAWRLDSAASSAGIPLGTVGDTLSVERISADGAFVLGTAGGLARNAVMVRTDGSPNVFHMPSTCQWGAGGFALGTRIVWEGCLEGDLRMWRNEGGTPKLVRTLKTEGVARAVSDDGTLVVVVFDSEDGDVQVRIINVATGKRISAYRMPIGIGSMRFTPNGRFVMIGGDDGIVRRFSVTQSSDVAELIGHTASIREIAFSKDGERMGTVAGDRTARYWYGGDGLSPVVFLHPSAPFGIGFPRDRSIVTVADDGRTRRWTLTGPPIAPRLAGDEIAARYVAFSPDGRRILSIANDDAVLLRAADGRGAVMTLVRGTPGQSFTTRAAAFTRDGDRVMTVGRGDTVRLWSADRTGTPPIVYAGAGGVTPNVAYFSADGGHVASLVNESGAVRIRTVDGLGDTASVPVPGYAMIAAVAPNGRAFAADGARDSSTIARVARYWASPIATPLVLPLPDFPASFTFSKDARTIAVTAGHSVVLWDVVANKARRLAAAPATVVDAQFSPDGTMLAVVAVDSAVRLLRIDGTGTPITLRATEAIYGAAFSPDGRTLATAGDGGVRLWKIRWNDIVRTLAAATSVCLGEDQRVTFLGKTAAAAQVDWLACERAHGRVPGDSTSR